MVIVDVVLLFVWEGDFNLCDVRLVNMHKYVHGHAVHRTRISVVNKLNEETKKACACVYASDVNDMRRRISRLIILSSGLFQN